MTPSKIFLDYEVKNRLNGWNNRKQNIQKYEQPYNGHSMITNICTNDTVKVYIGIVNEITFYHEVQTSHYNWGGD